MKEFTALVLAGGMSERFGCFKALYELGGKPLIHHVIERISSLTERIVIAAKECSLRSLDLPEVRVVPDKYCLHAAIVGLISSLEHVETEYVAVIPCDSPFVSPSVIKLLLGEAEGRSGAVPVWPEGKPEPLHAVYRTREIEDRAWECWNKGDLRIRCIIESMEDLVYVPIELIREVDPDLLTFLNLNSMEDLKIAKKVLEGS